MGEVEKKSFGTLIDELVTVRLKLYLSGEDIEVHWESSDEDNILRTINELLEVNAEIFFLLEQADALARQQKHVEVGEAYGKAQRLNSRRGALIAAIDRRFGEGDITPSEKTF